QIEQQSLELERARPGDDSLQESELAKVVQISMSQAIQIATAQQPGTIIDCRLGGYRKDGREYADYDVWIRYGDGAKSTVTRFFINAIDGRISEKSTFASPLK